MAASLGQSNGHPGVSLCIACEDAYLTSLHALGRTLDTHIAILALWRERLYVSGLDMMRVLMHVLHADYSVALHQWDSFQASTVYPLVSPCFTWLDGCPN